MQKFFNQADPQTFFQTIFSTPDHYNCYCHICQKTLPIKAENYEKLKEHIQLDQHQNNLHNFFLQNNPNISNQFKTLQIKELFDLNKCIVFLKQQKHLDSQEKIKETLDDYFDQIIQLSNILGHCCESTRQKYKQTLKCFFHYLYQNEIKDFTTEDISRFLEIYCNRNHLKALNLLRKAKGLKSIQQEPGEINSKKIINNNMTFRHLSTINLRQQDEFISYLLTYLLENSNVALAFFIFLLKKIACKLNDLRTIKFKQLEMQGKSLKIFFNQMNKSSFSLQYSELPSQIHSFLLQHHDPDQNVFGSLHKRRTLTQIFKKICKQASNQVENQQLKNFLQQLTLKKIKEIYQKYSEDDDQINNILSIMNRSVNQESFIDGFYEVKNSFKEFDPIFESFDKNQQIIKLDNSDSVIILEDFKPDDPKNSKPHNQKIRKITLSSLVTKDSKFQDQMYQSYNEKLQKVLPQQIKRKVIYKPSLQKLNPREKLRKKINQRY